MKTAVAALAAAIALLPVAAPAQQSAPSSSSYRCTGKDGKRYYGSTIPPQCLGQPVEQLNNQGLVIKRIDAAASAAEREKKAAEEEERKKREAISKEEGRRNRALLATYTSEKDIEDARARALKDNEFAVADIQKKITLMKQKLADTEKEMKDSAAKKQGTTRLEQSLNNTNFDIKTQQDLLDTKKREVTAINARYDEDVKRYRELTKGATTTQQPPQ